MAEEKAPKDIVAKLEILLEATKENDLKKFESICDKLMQDAMTPELLESVHNQLAEKLRGTTSKTYMGVVNRITFKTYYWKLSFEKEGSPEVLAELSIKDGKVRGFYLK